MDVPAELQRLIPRLQDAATPAHAEAYLSFLLTLTRTQHEEVIRQLGGLLTRHRDAVIVDEEAHYRFVLSASYQTILNYARHVPGRKVVRLLESTSGLGLDLARLDGMLTQDLRTRLRQELVARDAREAEAFLERYFEGGRTGIIDYAIEMALAEHVRRSVRRAMRGRLAGETSGFAPSRRALDDYDLLLLVQAHRRRDPSRLPFQPRTAEEIRFLVEEIHRELVSYPSPDEDRASALAGIVMAWYRTSRFHRTIFGRPIYGFEAEVFAQIGGVRSRIKLGATYLPHWNTYVVGALRSEMFWHNIAGLNHDIDPMSTEAGRRQQLYQRAALIGGLTFAGLLLAPVVIKLAVAAPGAIIRLATWSGRNVLIASRYAASNIRVYGLAGGSAKMARDGYVYYTQNAIVLNQRIAQGAEFFLELSVGESGFAPGASPADVASDTVQRVAALSRRGLNRLAADARRATAKADTPVDLIETVVRDADGKDHRIVGRLIGHEAGKMKVQIVEVSEPPPGTTNKSITFFGEAFVDRKATPDPRGTRDKGLSSPAVRPAAAANGNVPVASAGRLDDLARRRQQLAQAERLKAERHADNLAQRATLQQGRQQAAGAGGALDTQMARTPGRGPGGSDVGRVRPASGTGQASGRGAPSGPSEPRTSRRGAADTGTGDGARSIPEVDVANLPGVRQSPAGYFIVHDEQALVSLKASRTSFRSIGLKNPKSGGGAFQGKHVAASEMEWHVVSPSGIEAHVDAIAIDPRRPYKFVFVEAKATFVADPTRSAHFRFAGDKLDQLARQLLICLESNGKARMEIVTNASQAAETYLNITHQLLVSHLRKNFADQLRAHLRSSGDLPLRRLSTKRLEELIEDNIAFTVADWGRVK